MIHSCAGGVVRDKKYFTFAKVEILSDGKLAWYISNLPLLEVGDLVVVPYGIDNKKEKAKVLKIDKNVSEQVSPIPARRAKYILEIVDGTNTEI